MQLVEIIGIFLGIRYFIQNSTKRAISAIRILAVVLIISMTWFVGEIFWKDLSLIRLYIYQSNIKKYEFSSFLMTLPNGLISLLHLFGYQVTAAVSLCITLFSIEKERGLKFLWLFGSIISVTAMVLSGERSVLLATGFVLLFYYIYKNRKINLLSFFIFLFFFSLLIVSKTDIKSHIFARTTDRRLQAEAIGRVLMQFNSLKIIFNNPLGLSVAGKSWEHEVYSLGEDFSAWGGEIMSVHNGYLGRIISYGWILAGLILIVLFRLLKNFKFIFFMKKYKFKETKYCEIMALTLLALLIQALFHNASLFTFNAISITVLFLYLKWFDLLFIRM